jgi:glycosyltransferase involved in cell wall biosynthesis
VLLVGRKKSDSLPLEDRDYKMHRMRLLFEKGPFFYAEYNIRLFFLLLFKRTDILVSNDLDTLLANFLVSRLRKKPLIYDSHEYFTETPEVINRPFVRGTWSTIEKWIFPKLKYVFTVNQSLAEIFSKKYGVDVKVVRNVPRKRNQVSKTTRKELGLPADKPIILLQGAGINIQRGAEELVMAMQYLDDVLLLIIGGGDVLPDLYRLTDELGLTQKIRFLPRQSFEKLYEYTAKTDLGLTLDKDTNLNYRYSLPNKLFDYIHAGVPVLATPMVEIKRIIDEYKVGDTIESYEPEKIAAKIRSMISDKEKLRYWKENCKFASSQLCWENEKKVVEDVYREFV